MIQEPIIKTLWLFKYHTGQLEITQNTWAHLRLFYAVDEAGARKVVEKIIAGIKAKVYEEGLEALPHGFTTGRAIYPGKVEFNPDGTPNLK